MIMRRGLFNWSFLGCALALVLMMTLSVLPAAGAFKYLHKGMTVPQMKGKDLLTGKKVLCGQGDGHNSQVVIMAFWATWSPRSLEVLSDLKDLQLKFGSDQLHVIAINVEGNRIPSKVQARITDTVRELDLPYPVILDKDLEIFDTVGVIAVPSVAVLDSQHVMQYGPSGYSGAIADLIEDSVAIALGRKKQEAGPVAANSYRPSVRANRYYNLAVQLVNQGHYKRALSNLDRAVGADGNFSSPHSLQGQIHLAQGDPARARDSFSRAADLDESAVTAWAGWGRSLLRLDRPAQAESKLETALALEDAFTPALLDLASVRARSGNRVGAEELLDRVRTLNPKDPEVLFRLGKFHRESGELSHAVEAYLAALEQLIP